MMNNLTSGNYNHEKWQPVCSRTYYNVQKLTGYYAGEINNNTILQPLFAGLYSSRFILSFIASYSVNHALEPVFKPAEKVVVNKS
jgi:hypothetical protein